MSAGGLVGLPVVDIRAVEELLELLQLLLQGFLLQDTLQPQHIVICVCGALHVHFFSDLGGDSGSGKVVEL